MALERADKLTAPPVVGKFYLVPAIKWSFSTTWGNGRGPVLEQLESLPDAKWWPVWGRKHNDIEFFNFPNKHYHLDPRFLTKRQWCEFDTGWREPLASLQGKPLNHRDLPDGPVRPQLRRMKCTMAHAAWHHDEQQNCVALNRVLAGKQCVKSKLGFLCPHQRFPLASVEPRDGVITCPLHGLRINAETGICIGPVTDSSVTQSGSASHESKREGAVTPTHNETR